VTDCPRCSKSWFTPITLFIAEPPITSFMEGSGRTPLGYEPKGWLVAAMMAALL